MAAGRIQRYPRGLLSFLGMVGTGQNPVDLADQVTPTFQLNEHYLSSLLVARRASGTVQIAGNSLDLTVPSGELWLVRAVAATVTPNSAEVATISVAIRSADAITTRLFQSDQRTMGSNGNLSAPVFLGAGILLNPGFVIRLLVDQSTMAAARNADVTALVSVVRGS